MRYIVEEGWPDPNQKIWDWREMDEADILLWGNTTNIRIEDGKQRMKDNNIMKKDCKELIWRWKAVGGADIILLGNTERLYTSDPELEIDGWDKPIIVRKYWPPTSDSALVGREWDRHNIIMRKYRSETSESLLERGDETEILLWGNTDFKAVYSELETGGWDRYIITSRKYWPQTSE